jgi:hypothetical protein
MRLTTPLFALSLTVIAHGYLQHEDWLIRRGNSDFNSTCHSIAAAISSASEVYFPRMSSSLTSLDPPS